MEELLEDRDRIRLAERLAREDIQIDLVRALYKVARDIGGFNQLDERVAFCVTAAEMDDTRRTERHHVDSLDERLGEGGDCGFGSEGDRIAAPCIDH